MVSVENTFRNVRIKLENRRGSGDASGTRCVTSREMAAFEEPWWSCNVHDGGGQAKLEQSNSPVQSPWKVKDQAVSGRPRILLFGPRREPPKAQADTRKQHRFPYARFRKYFNSIWIFLRRSSACQDMSRSQVTRDVMSVLPCGTAVTRRWRDTFTKWTIYF